MSETPRCRERLSIFCKGYGIDAGFGGDPIIPSAVTVDLPQPYAKVGDVPVNLGGDARNLYWFKDDVLDYVYSSHLLEDFEDTANVLKEWLRVIRPGGLLILFCPDEQVYREHCKRTGQDYNQSHKIAEFSLNYVKSILQDNFVGLEIIHEIPLIDDYSFDLVVQKTSTTYLKK
jgi:predicted SAM-dependent methyltransferase